MNEIQIRKNELLYENQFNDMALKGFNSVDIDLLFFFLYKFFGKKGETLTFTFSEIKKAINYQKHKISDLVNDLDSMTDKLLDCKFKFFFNNKARIEKFQLFERFSIDQEEQILSARINKDFQFIINQAEDNWFFTRINIEQFFDLKSFYAKEAYRRLKRFRSTGKWIVKIDDFRKIFNVPPSYKMCNIDNRILKPIYTELRPYFKNLKYEKIKKAGRGRGGQVDKIVFTFDKERKGKKQQLATSKKNISKKSSSNPRPTGWICKKCGNEIYELFHNETVFFGHDYKTQGDGCKVKFNDIEELQKNCENKKNKKNKEVAANEENKKKLEQKISECAKKFSLDQ